jgi:phosphatidylglycerol lysyltransferase
LSESFSLEERIHYLKEFGCRSLAYSTLQPGLRYFDVPHIGYVGYQSYGGRDFVLSSPICADNNLETLLGEFIRTREHPCFVQIYQREADLLRDVFHHYVTPIGVEFWLHGETWTIHGGEKARIRSLIHTARNAGVTVRPLDTGELRHDVQRVSDQWRDSRRNTGNLRFLVRDFYADPALQALTRLYGAFQKGSLVGVLEFSPLFRMQRVTGYFVDIVRTTPGAPNGTSDLIITAAFQKFIQEKTVTLSLGLAPLAKLAPCPNEPPLLRKLLSLLYVAGNRMYHFKGTYFHKKKYRGEEVPVFYTTKNRNAVTEILSVLRLIGVF